MIQLACKWEFFLQNNSLIISIQIKFMQYQNIQSCCAKQDTG